MPSELTTSSCKAPLGGPWDNSPAVEAGEGPSTNLSSWVAEISRARDRIKTHLSPTPLVKSEFLSQQLQRTVLLKLESLQPVGAFKVRPALNSILASLEQCRASGIVTNSSGNFAQAVAFAASRLGVDAAIVMMRGASAFKRDRTRRFGGTVVLCEDTFAARSETTERIQKKSGRLLVHPFDSVESISGNGTLGLELLDQTEDEFTLFVPVSGGGLIAGTSLAVKAGRPGCRIFGVQAEANPATKRSLEQGRPVRTKPSPSLADALTVPEPGSNTFPIIQQLVEDVLLVSEPEIVTAIRSLALEQKLVVEAGGAVSVAAAASSQAPDDDSPIVCVVSGGNIDPALLRSILRESESQEQTRAPRWRARRDSNPRPAA